MSVYITVNQIKSAGLLDITQSTLDSRLLQLAQSMSRQIDRFCNRYFFVIEMTKKFDGNGTTTMLLPDLVSVDASGFKTDDNKDRTFETTWATTDYLLLPSNADPVSDNNPMSRPYTSVIVDCDAGTKSEFPAGVQTVQIAGKWGFWQHLKRAAETVNEAVDTSETEIDISARTDIEIGHTILVNSEQMFVKSYNGNTLTVDRAVNGTTAGTHSSSDVIDIYEYPDELTEACLEQVGRLFRRGRSGYANQIGFDNNGATQINNRMDRDVLEILRGLRKIPVGVMA